MAKLIAQSGHSLDLPTRRVTLGESAACDIPLAQGAGLAPVHFEMEPDGAGQWIIRDVSGGAGLLVNGVQITERVLAHGNVVMVGSLQLGFWHADAPEHAASPFVTGPVPAAAAAPLPAAPLPAAPLPAAAPAPAPLVPPPVFAPVPVAAPAVFLPQETAPAAPAPAIFSPLPPPAPELNAVPSALNHSVAGRAPSSAPLVESAPIPYPVPPPQAPSGPPVAWLNPMEAATPPPPPPMPAPEAPAAAGPVAASSTPAPVPLLKRRRWRGVRPGLLSRLPRPLVALLVLGFFAAAGTALMRVPAVASAAKPLWAKFEAWAQPEEKKPAASASAGAQQAASAAEKPAAPAADDGITPRAPHNNVVKIFLTERVSSLFQVDLRQLIPFYNTNATARSLPPQKEMTEAFRRHYGVLLDGFERLSCLRAPGRDEFVFILSGNNRVELENMIGLPALQMQKQAEKQAKGGKAVRIYPVKAAGRIYGIAQYDPFTVVLGNSTWIDSALNGSSVALREALCMFPESAARDPGALIMVERLPAASADTGRISPFQVAITNLFLNKEATSRLILTRNPDVKEEVFVEQSSAALREQSKAMLQGIKIAEQTIRKPSSDHANTVDPDEIITTAEASVAIPNGEALVRDAIDSVARTFMSQSPSMELILAAQTAVLRFNQAYLQAAPEAMQTTSVTEALELLQNGIVIRGTGTTRDVEIRVERMEPEQIDVVTHLLALEERIGLVFRPNRDMLSGDLLELAMKARDYRNAELLISLWTAAKFGPGDATDSRTAVRRILTWAAKEGHRKRISVGLPALTDSELSAAVDLLALDNGVLTWRPGEEGYRTWLRKVNPDPRTDAKRIAAAFRQAQKSGRVPRNSVVELSDAVLLINRGRASGIATAGESPGLGLSTDELRAAARFLYWDGGSIRLVEN